MKIPKDKIYEERIEKELNIMEDKNVFAYLIRALNILKLTSNVPHITRGSCGSSLVCYMLGISLVDPVKYNISFLRGFLTNIVVLYQILILIFLIL